MSTVADLMTAEVVTLDADDDLVQADQLMRLGRMRHLPVVDKDKVVGLITHRDILKAQVTLLARLAGRDKNADDTYISLRARELMNVDPVSVRSDTPAKEAAKMMLNNKFGCLPVIDDGELKGIITEADFLRWSIELAEKA
ncbi:MAG: CBS domain-containing protein [Myxococcota bacterium]